LTPAIAALQSAGVTDLCGLAAALNARGILHRPRWQAARVERQERHGTSTTRHLICGARAEPQLFTDGRNRVASGYTAGSAALRVLVSPRTNAA
jgi:hypothetical protein